MKLAFKIAWRFLKSSKGQSVLIAVGIAIGVSVQVFIGSLIQGLQSSLIDKTVGSSSHVTILSSTDDKTIEKYLQIESDIKKAESKIEKISSSADGFAFLKYGNKSYSVQVRGFDIEAADKIYSIKDAIIEGSMPEGIKEIIIGKELSKDSEVKIGDKIQMATATGVQSEYRISGIFDLKVAVINKNWVVMKREASQLLFQMGDKVTQIETQLSEKDVFKADEVALVLQNSLNKRGDLKIENWKAQNEQLLSGLNGQSASSGMIQVFVLVSVVLGIASVLAISVVQKSKQIGILKAMGIKDRTASAIFVFEGLLLGAAGSILGIAFGLGLSVIFTTFAVNADGTPVVPLLIDYKFIAASAVVAVICAASAAVIPARKSSKLNPIEVIKNG